VILADAQQGRAESQETVEPIKGKRVVDSWRAGGRDCDILSDQKEKETLAQQTSRIARKE